MSIQHPNKFDWFCNQEQNTGYNIRTFKNGISYEKIKTYNMQHELFESDFNDWDTGFVC